MGHKQSATPVQTGNTTAVGIVTSSIRQKRSKAMDMRFHWVQDQTHLGNFLIYWAPGKCNLADYFSKHHPAAHHRRMRPIYLLNQTSYSPLQSAIRIQLSKHFQLHACARVCSYSSSTRSLQYLKSQFNNIEEISTSH